MAEFPALPVWTDAYLADTRHLSTLEHGAYFLLMMEAWRRPTCSLPDDDTMLARLAGVDATTWSSIKPVILEMWKLDRRSKMWSQKRLSQEKDYVRRKSKVQRDKAAKRWNRTEKTDATAMPAECPADAPTPTPTPTPKEEDSTPSGSSVFEETDPTPLALIPSEGMPDDAQVAFDRFVALRREMRPTSKSLKLDPDRRAKLTRRLKEIGGLAGWETVLDTIRLSPFLRGDTGRWAFVTIEFLLSASSLRKLMEGNYDDHGSQHAGTAAGTGNRSCIDDLRAARAMLNLE